ncbi:hypothetical protein KAU11_04095, partial [Candidatus Babeliales bacterium]|nr:hypothetical protein [Candidatus Babeliales bacterium]
ATALTLLCLNAEYFVGMFDHQASFTKFASAALPVLAPLVAFDVIQLVLAGALRGAGDVKTVMITRLLGCGLFFVPAARLIHCISITDEWTKFVLIYGAFYLNTALMSLIFMLRIWGNNWSKKKV